MAWIWLLLAGLLEVAWSQSIKPTGAIGLGVLINHDPLTAGRLTALALIVGGVILARYVTA
ncbi:MAG: hypothetical protein H0U62_09375 [Actinobacteria bacterium]|jgi:quaternary ammonium compound-resistance protein SugE|nr:hypothetical protein [Actinomycetota bacterium]